MSAKGSKIVVFGGSGQVGKELLRITPKFLAPLSSEVDVSDRDETGEYLKLHQPSLVINCSAYTAVDKAESEKEQAFLVNSTAPEQLASICSKHGIGLIHISTDYIFAGAENVAIPEDAATQPSSVYGSSKLAGEKAVRELMGDKGLVVRTSSVFGGDGPNFVLTMLRLFKSKEEISVVNDQRMSPTWAGWLAQVLNSLAERYHQDNGFPTAVVHAVCSGGITWFEFANAILLQSGVLNSQGNRCIVNPTTAATYNAPALRPTYSVLSTDRLRQTFGIIPISWEDGLRRYLSQLGYEQQNQQNHG